MSKKKPLIVGLVGPSGSGKTTAAFYLQKKNYHPTTLSDYIKKEAKKKGYKRINKRLLQNLGNRMRSRFGPQILAQLALQDIRESIRENKTEKAVIDGIRNIYEITFLEKEDHFFLLGVEARPRLRYQRVVESKERGVGKFEDFLRIERRDSQLGKKEIGLRVKDCLKKADIIIENNNNLENFYCQLDKFLVTVNNKRRR